MKVRNCTSINISAERLHTLGMRADTLFAYTGRASIEVTEAGVRFTLDKSGDLYFPQVSGALNNPAVVVDDEADALEAAFIAGMREAARVCRDDGADWSYDLIINAIEARE